MIILPAIDLTDGQCVRLYKGDFSTVEKVSENPVLTAQNFKNAGTSWIHMVDLDGAKEGNPVNSDIIFSVAETSGLKIEVGGGIRNMETVEKYIESGISRVILGSAALSDPSFVKQAVQSHGDKIAVGIDARERMVAAEGWLKTSDTDFIDLAKSMEQSGVKCVIFTDISKDGTLSGPNLTLLDEINRAVSCNIIASGGITDINDIKDLIGLNLYGAICGKSIYKGTLDLKVAVNIAEKGEK